MSSVDESSRHRRRVTFRQLEGLWEFLDSHRDVAIGYNKSAQAREYSKRMWQSVAEALNSQGEGAFKDWKGWSNYWVDYKAKLKRRVAAVRQSQSRTGGGPSDVPPLSELDKKFLSLLGENFGAGLPNVQVDPFPNLPQSSTSIVVESELSVLPPPDSAPLSIDLHLQEAPQLVVVEELQPQEEFLQEAPSAQDEGVASTSRPIRQRRPRQGHISQEAARRTLVEIAKSRLTLDQKQTDLLQKQTDTMEQMLHTLNKIADGIEKIAHGPESRNEGAPGS